MAHLVNCNDGTTEVVCDMGCTQEMLDKIPCLNHGGVVDSYDIDIIKKLYENNPSVIEEKNRGRKEAQVGFGLGSALLLGYGIYKKKSAMSIIGLTLLGGLGGIIALSMIKK
jgi:hypothetical protein